jgi:hypothetical protein
MMHRIINIAQQTNFLLILMRKGHKMRAEIIFLFFDRLYYYYQLLLQVYAGLDMMHTSTAVTQPAPYLWSGDEHMRSVLNYLKHL